MQNSFFKEWVLNRTILGWLLLEQKSFEQRLTHHKMMAVRLCLAVDAQVI